MPQCESCLCSYGSGFYCGQFTSHWVHKTPLLLGDCKPGFLYSCSGQHMNAIEEYFCGGECVVTETGHDHCLEFKN